MSLRRFRLAPLFVALAAIAPAAHAQVVNSEWNVGNGDWNVPTNWFPNDAPDNGGGFTYDVEIGNRPVAAGAQVTFIPEDGTGDTINTLIVSAAADLFTNGSQLNVNGLTTITGVGSTIRVDPRIVPTDASVQLTDLDLTAGGALVMSGGVASVFADMDVASTSVLSGHGTLNVGDLDATVEQAFQNSGLIQVSGTVSTPGVLTISASGVDTIDLDGDNDQGIVDVSNAVADVELDTLTLIIDGPLSDGFGSVAAGATLQIGQRDTVTFNDNFEIDAGATITMDGGNNVATLNGPGAITDIADADFTVAGDAVIANDMTFSGTANTITVNANSSLTLGGAVTIPDASALSFASSTAELIVSGSLVVNEAAGNFNWDGPGTATTTVEGTGSLSLIVNFVDSADNTYGGTLNLNDGGDLTVNNAINSWQAAGTVNKNGAGTSSINGDEFAVTGDLNVNAGTLDVNADAIFGSTSDVVIAAGSTALMATTQIFNGADVTVNGTLSLGVASILEAPASLTGTGLFRFNSSSTVTANAVVNTTSFDWDGTGAGTTHTINNGVVFTVNSTIWDADDASPGVDDNINLGGNGAQIIVNNVASWTMARTLNANTAMAGTATIGGTSPFILEGALAVLNVDGNLDITSVVTFGASSTTSIDAGMELDLGTSAGYEGGTIGGLGTFLPASANFVTANSTINATTIDFDAGGWVIQNNALLTVNVTDYETGIVTNTFDATISLNDGDISVTTGDAEFVMDGVLNMNSTIDGQVVTWSGEPLDIGNDAGVLDADLNVTGTQQSQIGAPVDFNSDADVDVAAGATLAFLSTVNFDTVNAANNAQFTGAGTIAFSAGVNVNEAVTLNMVGGTVDLDGLDNFGDFVNIDAPLAINAATMASFGRTNGGGVANTLDVNNSVGTGALTVNLDNAADEWTLNAEGVINLVNDNAAAVLLAGSDVNLNGTVNVTGDVQTNARVDIGGTVNLNTAAEPLRLNGGSNLTDFNTIAGGTVNGPGVLNAPSARALHGHGTINANVDFDGSSNLLADDGTLTLNGAILDVNLIGTNDDDAILQVTNAWNTNVAQALTIRGGEVRGGTITNDAAGGILGDGLLSARVINNTMLAAGNDLHLIVETAGDDNDWDGTTNTGMLVANFNRTLEIRDTGAAFGFGGTVSATDGGRVYASGFGLDFNPGSTLSLTAATFQADESTDLGGTVTIGAGLQSTIQVQNNRFLSFETGSATTLNGNLQLVNNNIIIEAGATFSGGGALVVPDGSHLVADNLANVGVLVDMQGAFRPGNSEGIGRIDLFDYQQADTSELFVEIAGTALNAFDRLVLSGDAVLDGYLNIDIDGGFIPALGNTFNIISANTVTGQFNNIDVSGMPDGLTFHVNYLANAVQLQVVNTPLFSADFDEDGDVDATDLTIWKGAYDLNQLGDADGDNDSDGADFLVWQQQLGSHPAVAAQTAVPEPGTALLSGLVAFFAAMLRRQCARGGRIARLALGRWS